MRLSKSHLLILSLALAAFALWLNIWLESNQQTQAETPKSKSEQAIWQFSDTQLWRPQLLHVDDKQNATPENFYLHAGKVTYQQQKTIQIEQLNLVAYSGSQFNLISSDLAEIMPDQSMQFQQQQVPVTMQHWREKAEDWQREIQLSGEQFTYNEQQQTLLSEKPVTLSQPDATIHAGGLEAALADGNWNLTNGVQGQFQLPPRQE